MHKIHHIGLSGCVFTACGDVRSSIEYIDATGIDDKVDCELCLHKMAHTQALNSDGKEPAQLNSTLGDLWKTY